jgi:hypothetical protein
VPGNPDIQPTFAKNRKGGWNFNCFPLDYWAKHGFRATTFSWRSGLPDTILEGDHPWTIPPKFGLKMPSGFRGEYF